MKKFLSSICIFSGLTGITSISAAAQEGEKNITYTQGFLKFNNTLENIFRAAFLNIAKEDQVIAQKLTLIMDNIKQYYLLVEQNKKDITEDFFDSIELELKLVINNSIEEKDYLIKNVVHAICEKFKDLYEEKQQNKPTGNAIKDFFKEVIDSPYFINGQKKCYLCRVLEYVLGLRKEITW